MQSSSRPKREAAVAAAAVLTSLMVQEVTATRKETSKKKHGNKSSQQNTHKRQRLICNYHDHCVGQRIRLSYSDPLIMESHSNTTPASTTNGIGSNTAAVVSALDTTDTNSSNDRTEACATTIHTGSSQNSHGSPRMIAASRNGHDNDCNVRDLSTSPFEQEETEEEQSVTGAQIERFLRPAGATLRELIQKGLEICSNFVLDEQFWTLIHLRIKSHPMEVTSRDFQSILMFFHFPHQIVPDSIIREFFQTKRVTRWWNTFRHVATGHWTSTKTIRLLIDAADDKMEIINFCARLFSLLEENEYSVPPPLAIIREILSCPEFGLKVLQEMIFDDGKVAMHYACFHEQNADYVRLIAQLAKGMDEPLAASNRYYGGLFKYDCTDETPLKKIVLLWSDKMAAEMIAELFVLYENIAEKLPTNILHHAISKEKWEVCKLLIQKAPRLLTVNNRIQGTPLNTMIQFSNVPNLALAALMVEQGLRVANNDPILKDTCGLLLMSKHSNAVSPLHYLYEVDRSQAKILLDQIILYLTIEMQFRECFIEDVHNCIVRLLKELVLIQWWEYLEEFVVKYPSLLSAKDSDDNFPLHHICKSQDSPLNLIRLVIESGIEVEVGGKKARGGLVTPNNRNEYPLQLLCTRSCKSNNQLLKHLIKTRPKLILKRD
jgi:hypothetical protein